jgi:hypothetical protein
VYMASLCDLGSSIESSENGFGFRIHVSGLGVGVQNERGCKSLCFVR